MTTGQGRMTEDEKIDFHKRIATLYAEGKSTREIAVETGRALNTVRRALAAAGIPRRRPGFQQPTP